MNSNPEPTPLQQIELRGEVVEHAVCTGCRETLRYLAAVVARGHSGGLVEPAWEGPCSCRSDHDDPECPRDAKPPTICIGCAR